MHFLYFLSDFLDISLGDVHSRVFLPSTRFILQHNPLPLLLSLQEEPLRLEVHDLLQPELVLAEGVLDSVALLQVLQGVLGPRFLKNLL